MKNFLRVMVDNQARPKAPELVIRNSADEATLYIYDAISKDWGVSASSVIRALADAEGAKTLNLRINSPGGDVFEARAIVAALKRFDGHVIAHVDSLAASAATTIALAAHEVVIAKGGLFMIHNASTIVWGDKNAMRTTADLLDKIDADIVDEYTTKTGKTADEVQAWMDAETWFTAQEALDQGFVDRIADDNATKNKATAWNLAGFKNAPKNHTPAPEPEPTPEPAKTPEAHSATANNANRLRLALLA